MSTQNNRYNHHYFVDGIYYTKEEREQELKKKWPDSEANWQVHDYTIDKDGVLQPWTALLEEAVELCHDNLYEPKSPLLFDFINRDQLELQITSQNSRASRSALPSHSPYYVPENEKRKHMITEETHDYLRFITCKNKENTSLEAYLKEYILPEGFEFTERERDILKRIHYVAVKTDYKVWVDILGEVGEREIDVDLLSMDVETFRNNVFKLDMEIEFEMHTKQHEYVCLHFNFKHRNTEANQL